MWPCLCALKRHYETQSPVSHQVDGASEGALTEEEDTSPRSRAMSVFLARRRAGDPTPPPAATREPRRSVPSRRPALPTAEPEAVVATAARTTSDGMPERSPPRVSIPLLSHPALHASAERWPFSSFGPRQQPSATHFE